MMIPDYVTKLGLVKQKTDVSIQKIDHSLLVTHEVVLAGLSVQDNLGKTWFFEETFLFANTSIEVLLKMVFLTLSNVDI